MAKEKPTGTKPTAATPSHAPAPAAAPAKGAGADVPGKCLAVGCKHNSKRFDFCAEHFEHFKFGLITKAGKQVSDYDKKIDHYHAYVARTQGGRKAA